VQVLARQAYVAVLELVGVDALDGADVGVELRARAERRLLDALQQQRLELARGRGVVLREAQQLLEHAAQRQLVELAVVQQQLVVDEELAQLLAPYAPAERQRLLDRVQPRIQLLQTLAKERRRLGDLAVDALEQCCIVLIAIAALYCTHKHTHEQFRIGRRRRERRAVPSGTFTPLLDQRHERIVVDVRGAPVLASLSSQSLTESHRGSTGDDSSSSGNNKATKQRANVVLVASRIVSYTLGLPSKPLYSHRLDVLSRAQMCRGTATHSPTVDVDRTQHLRSTPSTVNERSWIVASQRIAYMTFSQRRLRSSSENEQASST